MKEVQAPNQYKHSRNMLFLAGSIEMGTAEPWQQKVVESLQFHDVTILNPRRNDWDSSWVQTASNPQFNAQVNWELTGLEQASIVVFYFDPNTKSPITLLEFGFLVGRYMESQQNIVVCCPQGFWRRGNLEVVCERYDIDLLESLDELIYELRTLLPLTKPKSTPAAVVRRAVMEGYPFTIVEIDEDADCLVVVENPDYEEPDGDPNLVCTYGEFIGQ